MNRTKLLLSLILIFSFLTRVWRIAIPSDFYFDEVYHAFTAEAYSRNDPRGYEWWHPPPEGVAYEWLHPPISKLIMGLSIYTFGDVSFAWRFPSTVFGVLVVWMVFKLTKLVFKKDNLALLAATVASLDGLLLTLSRIAMNDIYVTFFILCALYFYYLFYEATLKHRKIRQNHVKLALLSGLLSGLALSTKWSGVFVIATIATWEIFASISYFSHWKDWLIRWASILLIFITLVGFSFTLWKYGIFLAVVVLSGLFLALLTLVIYTLGKHRFLLLFVSFAVIPPLIYLASFGQFWLQPRADNIDTFINLHKQIWWYQTNLEATHPYQSTPKQWVLNTKPVWFYVDWQDTTTANIYALANPAVAWIGIFAMSVLALVSVILKKPAGLFILSAYLWVWLPWTLSPRIMFFYHYTPAIPFLAIAISWFVIKLWDIPQLWSKTLASGLIMAIAVLFIYFFPQWTGLPIPKEWADQYFWFKSWK